MARTWHVPPFPGPQNPLLQDPTRGNTTAPSPVMRMKQRQYLEDGPVSRSSSGDLLQSQLLSDCRPLLVSGGKHPLLQAKILHNFISGASERFWFSVTHAHTNTHPPGSCCLSSALHVPAAVEEHAEKCHTPPRSPRHVLMQKDQAVPLHRGKDPGQRAASILPLHLN